MSYLNRNVEGGGSLKLWIEGLSVDVKTYEQLEDAARLPIVFGHVAVMPDVHYGRGATIGSVIATKGAIIPSAVGMDIGCGMQAVRTNLKLTDVEGRLGAIHGEVEGAILKGYTDFGGFNCRSRDLPQFVAKVWFAGGLQARYEEICQDDPKLFNRDCARQLGTLGGGNHFIELSVDREGWIWWMLHSGSRGPGASIAGAFAKLAAKAARSENLNLPSLDLAYFREGTALFDRYVRAMLWAQDFARHNRDLMMNSALTILKRFVPAETTLRIDCHHNFASRESHFGQTVWVTRKGATRAQKGEWAIIPGSMGAKSHIARGLGNAESYSSCSHGAGRAMSRTVARQSITLASHIATTVGVECCKETRVIDESPAAYKDLEVVMRAQADLVEPVHALRPLLNLKG